MLPDHLDYFFQPCNLPHRFRPHRTIHSIQQRVNLALGIDEYIGADIVPDLIARNRERYGTDQVQFRSLDLTRDKLPRVDVILCRDCLIHFSFRHVDAAIRNFKRSGSTYLLTNSYPAWRENKNIRTGDFRPLNLTLPPFDFPSPLRQINEKHPEEDARFFGKILGLWKLSDL